MMILTLAAALTCAGVPASLPALDLIPTPEVQDDAQAVARSKQLAAEQARTQSAQEARALAEDPQTRRAYFSRDWMIGIAGNDVILRSDLDTLILQDPNLRRRWQTADVQGRGALYEEALGLRLEMLLRVQAGMDLGFDPAIVSQRVDLAFEDRIERLGGHRATSQALQSDQLTPDQFREMMHDQLLSSTWYQVQVGRAPGRTGRITVDRHVRPGWILSAYQAFVDSPSESDQKLVGKKDKTFSLQILRIPVEPGASPADAEALALELHRMYTAGEVEFDFLVRTYGDAASGEKLGRLDPLSHARAVQVAEVFHGPAGQSVGDLLTTAQIGAATLPLFRSGPSAWLIWRLEAIHEGNEAQPLSSPSVQQSLRTFLLKTQDESREKAAFSEILGDAFVYPAEFGPFLNKRNMAAK